MVVFNDGNLYDRPVKQKLVFDTLSKARVNAFNRLMADSVIRATLSEMGILNPEDIDILLGSETHILLGGEEITDLRKKVFFNMPTDAEITALSEKFASLGGIIMTEVNPNGGSKEQQEEFIARITTLMAKLPGLKGIILYNIFLDLNDDNPELIYELQRLQPFEIDGAPTKLYYALLSNR